MEFVLQLAAIVLATAFPAFLVKAVKAPNKETTSGYTALACGAFGFIVFTLICSL